MIRAIELQAQRNHKAMLWRNLRDARKTDPERAREIERVFGPLFTIKLPRIPRHGR